MNDQTPSSIRLADYRPPAWLVERIDLDFRLAPEDTHVTATMAVRANPSVARPGPLRLDGDGLTLDSVERELMQVVLRQV